MKLITIPDDKYNSYRLDIIFNAYKWDPQWYDNETIARHILIISEDEANFLEKLTEKLTAETIASENFLKNNIRLCKQLKLPRQTLKSLKHTDNYNPSRHIRLMRFDFHPVADSGFAVSEVNSDVPGGFAEASLMPAIANKLLNCKYYQNRNFGEILTAEIAKKVKLGGRIAMSHCTSYSDDRQNMQFLGDKLESMGYSVIYCASDHLKFINQKAICTLDGNEGEIDFIFRFTPLEWLIGLQKNWHGHFDTQTPSCNHPVAMFAQTKRYPLIWSGLEKLGFDFSTWRRLLPETLDPGNVKNKEGFIYKPACGRVGEGITIKAAMQENEYRKTIRDAHKHPERYVAQKMFHSLPLVSNEGEKFHLCIGVHSIEGKAAGFYSRISKLPRIDSNAADIPVLIERRNQN